MPESLFFSSEKQVVQLADEGRASMSVNVKYKFFSQLCSWT